MFETIDEGGALLFLRQLIAAQRDGEAAVQAAVAARLGALGFTVETRRYDPAGVPMVAEFASAAAAVAGERESVVATLAGGGGGRSVILFAHPDGEPLAGLDRWRRDPFAGEVDGGRIHGWGVADDLAGVAAGVLAFEAIARAGIRLKGDAILASTPSKRHARGVSALMHEGLVADAAIYLHPAESGAGMREIKAFCSGQVEFRVTVSGREPETSEPSHTAFAHRATSAFDKAMVVREALARLDARRAARTRHPLLEAAVGRSTNLLVGVVAAGVPGHPSRIPTRCTLECALAFPPPETLGEVRAEVEACVAEAARADAFLSANPPLVEWIAGTTGAETPASHPLYRAVADAIVATTGEAPFVNPLHTASDIRNPIVQKAIPTVGIGPLCGDLAQNGRVDEWVDVADFMRAIRVVARATVAWCGAA